ncbi:MAG: sterol desaturase family protein [Deltaproteobacteria bacterium]|nr:sterol desaturase family protein [Deltaproteobacteria bacterium]
MTLLAILAVGYGASFATFVWLARAIESPAMRNWIISADPERSVDAETLGRSVRLNAMVSVGFMGTVSFLFRDRLLYEGDVALWRLPLEIVLVTLVYDFGYYAIHRYPFHEWEVLRAVHAVHHKSRHPRGIDSLLLHPLETCIGLGAFLASIAFVGGVHVVSFAILFVGYTTLNVVNHAGIAFARFPLRTLGHLAVQHDKHHRGPRAGNFAFLTAIPDTIFGTIE